MTKGVNVKKQIDMNGKVSSTDISLQSKSLNVIGKSNAPMRGMKLLRLICIFAILSDLCNFSTQELHVQRARKTI